MTSPVLPLRVAIRAACAADATLSSLMDPAIHDEAPRNAGPVYATFGEASLRDLSSSTERGHEQDVVLAVWAKAGSAASALGAAERLATLLDDAPLALAGHRLVSLSVTGLEAGRDPDSGTGRTILRLRAVTETIS